MDNTPNQTLNHILVNTLTENIDKNLFEPAIRDAVSYDCMIGYFDSSSFQTIAKSLLIFLKSNINYKMRFIVSPNLSKKDLSILLNWYENPESLKALINSFKLTENSLKRDTLLALAYLLVNDRIEIKLAFPKHGIFHVKCWLFKQISGNELLIHGSSNHTLNGLGRNFEYLVVENSKNSLAEKNICHKVRSDFDLLWNNNFSGVVCGSLSINMVKILLSIGGERDYSNIKGIIKNLENTLIEDINRRTDMDEKEYSITLENIINQHRPPNLIIPNWLNYQQGDYKHQGEAINKWFKNDCSGILSIATGGGKTLTSLTAASLLSEKVGKLLVIIAVPTVALMNQWADEVSIFSINAINTNALTKPQKKQVIDSACTNLKFNASRVEVIILTHDALQSEITTKIEKFARKNPTLLIADEVHNLGSLGFLRSPPNFFKYKIGLSATPIRQFDESGTEFLLEYFNGIVYEYTLDEAIGKCLVEFDYYVHPVYLTLEEEDNFYAISKKIKKLSFAATLDKESEEFKLWSNLCIQRRRVIETAENKINIFARAFLSEKSGNAFTLIFCSDKEPEQLLQLNNFLKKNFINYHQITSKETSKPELLAKVIQDYNEGLLQVLTSKRVLDEGFNVPNTKTAYILASNTTKKQWTQRLGRVLRKAPNKHKATIHDFIVLPNLNSGVLDTEFKGLLSSEMERIHFFVSYAANGLEEKGAISILEKLADILSR